MLTTALRIFRRAQGLLLVLEAAPVRCMLTTAFLIFRRAQGLLLVLEAAPLAAVAAYAFPMQAAISLYIYREREREGEREKERERERERERESEGERERERETCCHALSGVCAVRRARLAGCRDGAQRSASPAVRNPIIPLDYGIKPYYKPYYVWFVTEHGGVQGRAQRVAGGS